MSTNPQVVSSERYHLIPRVLIFLLKEDQILLIKGAPHKRIWANQYNGIGGHIERGENIVQAAYRELSEETGLSNANLRLCGIITIDVESTTGIGLFVFRGTFLGGQITESSEGSLHWILMKKVTEYELVEDLYVLLPKVIDHAEGDPIIIGQYHYTANHQLMMRFN